MMWYQPGFELGGSVRAHLKVDGLSAGYGAMLVLRGLKLEVKPGLTVILGPNGAGKTTLLRALNGLIARSGDVLLDGEDLSEKTHEIVQAGVALVPEGRQLFAQMTVEENLELGGWLVPKAERARRLQQAFNDFPKLKIILSHGGGAIPYQLGRFEAPSLRRGTGGRFSDGMRKLYYDTVLYTEDALRLLIKTVGVDRCLFGTECPGVGSSVDPATGRSMDNVKPMIENIEWLSAADRKKIFEDNAKAVFNLKVE